LINRLAGEAFLNELEKSLGIRSEKYHPIDPNTIEKEVFEIQIKPKKRDKLEFMLEITTLFDVKIARKRNKSFNDFFESYLMVN
jgi:hypothetical protein